MVPRRGKTFLLTTLAIVVGLPAGLASAGQPEAGDITQAAPAASTKVTGAGSADNSVVGKPSAEGPAETARRTGKRVELPQHRTETAQVFVEPSGLHTLEQYAYPVRARKGNGWAPIDTRLRFQPDGSVRPGATATELKLSGGGDGAGLVALGKSSAQVRMGWPGRLPKPLLDGDTATYPEVLPGVDLRLRVTAVGFAQVLVVKNRTAAADVRLRELRFPLSSTGLRISTSADGTTTAKDASGRSVFSAGAAAMWDSPVAPAAKDGSSGELKHRTIPTRKSGNDLVVTADREMLTSPRTRFPLYIDPSWDSDGNLWTHVNQMSPGQSYWSLDRNEGAKVGFSWDSAVRYRSFFQLRTEGLNGVRVISARFNITLDHSPTGSPTPTDLHLTAGIDPATPLTWDNSGGHWLRYLATAQGNAWTNGGQQNMSMGFTSEALKTIVQDTASRRTGQITFGLRAPDEGKREQWKKFIPDGKLVVVYNNPARTPLKVNFARPTTCGTAAAPTMISTLEPSFAAVASDPDGDNLTTRLAIHRASDNGLEYQVDSGTTTSGAAFAWPQVPAGHLTEGTTYYFVARSNDNIAGDGVEFSADSPKCYFKVDTVSPGKPTLVSTDYPDGEPGSVPAWGLGVVTAQPAPGEPVAEYLFGHQQDKVTGRIKAEPDGTAKIPLTVWPDPVTQIPSRTLYVKAVDFAGNVSAITDGYGLAALDAPRPKPARGDINNDGRADVSMVLDHGFGRTAVWNLPAKADGFHTGTLAWDSGDNGGFPLFRTRSVQGDFDDKGGADIGLFREEPGRRISLYLLNSDGNRYAAPAAPAWTSGGAAWPLSTARVLGGEVTGDTKADIIVQLASGTGSWRTLVFAGGKLGTPVEWSRTAAGSGDWALSAPVIADIDGDGKGDLVSMKDLGGCRTVTEYYKSSGTSFATTPVVLHDSGAGQYCWERSKPVAGDVDADGKDDVVAMYENGQNDLTLKVLRSTGTALTLSDWRRVTQFDPARVAVSVGDYNQDQRDDVALVQSLDGGGRAVHVLDSTGTAFTQPVARWQEARVGASLGPKFDIEHRTYELVARNSGRCLEVAGASQTNPANLQQWDCAGGLHQRFRIVPQAGTDQFEVHSVHVNVAPSDGKARCLDVGAQSTADNTPVVQWHCAGTANQQVLLEYVEGSSYDTVVRMKFAHSNKCGAIAGGATGNGAKVVQQPCAAVASQQWILRAALNTPQLEGRYKVSPVISNYVLDIKDCIPDRGIRLWDWLSSSCQKWQLKPLGDDLYQIIDTGSSTAVQVSGCSTANGGHVVPYPVDRSDCQAWRIEPANGSYTITQVRTGKAMDVPGCSAGKTPTLNIWPYWNGPCQQWRLEKQG